MALSKPFAEQLALTRSALNDRVASERSRAPGFDTEMFSAFLQSGVDPIVKAVADSAPDNVPMVVDALFSMALKLIRLGHAGPKARKDTVNRLWAELAPGFARLIAEDPVNSLGVMSNVAIKVAGDRHIRTDEWLGFIQNAMVAAETVKDVKPLCLIAAWRAGGAEIRLGALDAVQNLPEPLACLAMGAPKGSTWTEIYKRLERDIWWRPDNAPVTMHKIGDFTGFGGQFSDPPEIRPFADGFVVRSAKDCFELCVDAFGASLRPLDAEIFDQATMSKRTPKWPNQLDRIYVPDNSRTIVQNDQSLALVSDYSFHIYIAPRDGVSG